MDRAKIYIIFVFIPVLNCCVLSVLAVLDSIQLHSKTYKKKKEIWNKKVIWDYSAQSFITKKAHNDIILAFYKYCTENITTGLFLMSFFALQTVHL